MNNEITIGHQGEDYTAEYYSCGGSVTVILPNGNMRQTDLDGLILEDAVRHHLEVYISSQSK